MKTCRTIFAAVALAALAGNASLAQHGGGKSAPGHGAAHHQSSAPGASAGTANLGAISPAFTSETEKSAGPTLLPATVNGIAIKNGSGEAGRDAGPKTSGRLGKTGAAVHSIDLVRPDDGYANLRRRAMRSTLIANAPKKSPAVVPAGNIVVHPPVASPTAVAKNAIGVTAPSTGIQNPAVAHPLSGVAAIGGVTSGNLVNRNMANGNVMKTSIGGNAGEVRHETPRPVPTASAFHSTGLSGTTMGHPAVNAAPLGGPAHIVSGIGGGSMRPKY